MTGPIDTSDPLSALRDAGYIGLGFGVIVFQRAQVLRREIARDLSDKTSAIGSKLGATTPRD